VAEARWLAERGVEAIIAVAVQSLRAKAEAQGCGDLSPLWSGQAVALGSELGAAELTHKFAAEALDRLRSLAGWQRLPLRTSPGRGRSRSRRFLRRDF
jgi:hypothetical protein